MSDDVRAAIRELEDADFVDQPWLRQAVTTLTDRLAAVTRERDEVRGYSLIQAQDIINQREQIADRDRALAALRELVSRLKLALKQYLPPDPHCSAAPSHSCNAECEEMYYLSVLLHDARRALETP